MASAARKPRTMPKELECSDCQESFPAAEVIDGICENCDSNYVLCEVCGDRRHEDDTCGHVFWDNYGGCGYGGAGGSDLQWDDHEESFLAVLRHFPADVVSALRAGLARHSYRFGGIHATGGLGPSFITATVNGVYRRDVGEAIGALQDVDDIEAIYLGVNWLMSLQAGRTWRQDALTVKWIDGAGGGK